MPSRKLTAHCPSCHAKNHLRAPFCSQCGRELSLDHMPTDADGRAKLYADIAHPINSACREMIQEHVIDEYEAELERAKEPGYVSRYDDFDVDYNEPRRGPRDADRPTETRIDAAHDRRGPHAPRDGGLAPSRRSTGPAPAPNLNHDMSASSNDGFGAGIFPDDRS